MSTSHMIGIENVNEYYTNHYVDAILASDVKPLVERWKAKSDEEEVGTEEGEAEQETTRSPWRRLGALQREFFQLRDRLERRRSAAERIELHVAVARKMLDSLGYEVRIDHQEANGRWLPLLCAYQRSDGSPLLWIVPATSAFVDTDSETSQDVLSRPLLPELHELDPEPPDELDPKALADTSVETIVTMIFGLEEPPRFVLVVGDLEWVLADRGKWAEQRLLRFDWVELLGRRDSESLQAVTALLHREALVPDSGTPLVDTLDESSHNHAYGVSKDLKYALRECIELIGNEAIHYRREVSKKKVFNEEVDGQQLAIECIRYMYRLLFLLYVEARPELGYAPMGEQSYARGYSFDRLRDLETVDLDSEEERNGTYIHGCLQKLFEMVYEGTEAVRGQEELEFTRRTDDDESEDVSLHHTFRLVPLRSHLFDPGRTPFLSKIKLRNGVLLEVIKLMSLTRPDGKKKRRGRISYATLGINQLGEVYEALLSFRGFFAEETLYEVKPAKVKEPDPIRDVAYFVPEGDLEQYKQDERVFDNDGNPRAYEPGTFIYRMAGRDREKSASYYTPEVLTKCLVKYALKELLEDEDGNPKYEKAEDLLELTICEPAMGSAAFLNEAINQLAERYLQARQQELGERIPHDKYLEELQRVRMYLADNNVFGVDLNPIAVELAEVSLWLNAIFAQETDRGREVFVPWFGGQLACGNSLVGAWRKVFPAKSLSAGKDGKEVAWLDTVPKRVPLGTERPKGSVHHFLLPDHGMATYGEGTEGRPIRDGWGDQLKKIDAWRKEQCKPLSKEDIKALQSLSDAIDKLWHKHAELYREIRQRTTDPLSVYGHEHPDTGRPPTTTEEKDRIWANEFASEQIRASSPYRRLKLAMDYWCALWFWPIERVDLLPDRDEWLADLAMLLEPGVLPALRGGDDQRELFAPTMPADEARTLVDEVGFADVERIIGRSERLRLVDEVTTQFRFMQWELEYADVFSARGGFDICIGNPPWVRIAWSEKQVLGDSNPAYVLRSLSASAAAVVRDGALAAMGTDSYLREHQAAAGLQSFLSAQQNNPPLIGEKMNLYKAFLLLASGLGRQAAVAGLLHPEGVFDAPKGGALRKWLYPRLRRHYQFRNELPLFRGTNDHGRLTFSVNVYSDARKRIEFVHMANVFHPRMVDESHVHDGSGPIPTQKAPGGGWDLRGHANRLLVVGEDELELFASLYDSDGTPTAEARLAATHSSAVVPILRRMAAAPRLADLSGSHRAYDMWVEHRAQKDGTIAIDVGFPSSTEELVLSGAHFHVANPVYKTPRRVCTQGSHFDVVDLAHLPANYLPRTKFRPACAAPDYGSRVATLGWGDDAVRMTQVPRVLVNRGLGMTAERTLQPIIAFVGPSHINSAYSYAFELSADLLCVAASWSSLVVDFFVKTTGASDFYPNIARRVPLVSRVRPQLAARLLMLNCVTEYYASIWKESFSSDFCEDNWGKSDDPLLPTRRFSDLTADWTAGVPLRSHYERRQALVELDVLVAREMGLSLLDLLTIYRTQFHVLHDNEAETYYDQSGRIVFTPSKGLPGVGLRRTPSRGDTTPSWRDVQHMALDAGYSGDDRIEQVVIDDTLPGGPREVTIVYQAPWVRCDREEDYGVVWKHFEGLFGKVKQR